MFGRRNKKKIIKDKKLTNIQVIPEIFYGGNDPEIYQHHLNDQDKNIAENKSIKKVKKTSGNGSTLKSKNFLIAFVIILFVIVTVSISWFYLKDYITANQLNKSITETKEKQSDGSILSENVEIEKQITSSDLVATTSISDFEIQQDKILNDLIPTTTPSLDENLLTFPPISLLRTSDVDGDQLTDSEEEIFNTDSGSWDSDEDGYYDGQEVFNLYNPKELAPKKLIDSGLVREYANPIFNYRVYYPLSWRIGLVDTMGEQVLFSTISGDYIEINTLQKDLKQEWISWFSKNAKGQKITDLLQFTNRFKIDGWKRRDDLVAYFVGNKQVYVLTYHPSAPGPIDYIHIMQMMIQSFRHSNIAEELPEQIILPQASTSSINTDSAINDDSTTSSEVLSP